MNLSLEELKILLGDAFEKGNVFYLDLKEELIEKIVEDYLESKKSNISGVTVSESEKSKFSGITISTNENIDSGYYYYTSDNLICSNQIGSSISIFR